MPVPVEEVVLGIYLGLLTGVFPAFIAFSLGFSFKYFTNVTVPGLGVVALAGALAGISGGLMGILDPELAESWTGIIAIIVILMASLWAHSVGDTLGTNTPRRLTLQSLRAQGLPDLVDRVDAYGHFRVRPIGDIRGIEGYPPLGPELRAELSAATWRFPSDLPLATIEDRLSTRLLEEYELVEVDVTVDRRGRARIAVAPEGAGLSRRVPAECRAVSIETVLPTGMTRGDTVTVRLPEIAVSGTVLSARTAATTEALPAEPTSDDEEAAEPLPAGRGRVPTTDGGCGRITVAVPQDTTLCVLEHEFAPVIVHSRGRQRAFELTTVLQHGNYQIEAVELPGDSPLTGKSVGEASAFGSGEITILAIDRGAEHILFPGSDTTLQAGDQLILRGTRDDLGIYLEGTL